MEQDCKQFFKEKGACVIVPTYNNAGTVIDVLDRLQPFVENIIVVNDGSTDNTQQLLEAYDKPITVVSYLKNGGKGCALKRGFEKAVKMGFVNAITIDSDGQHYPEDLPRFAETMKQHPGALIVGNRKLMQENMPGKNTFANYFSNFWFMVQTWQYLPDTQTGYRVYPLIDLKGLNLLTCRYEAELELLVLSAWAGIDLVSTPIRVYYPPQEKRVSHFRPGYDFFRISVLNTVLCLLCLCYGWWAMLWNSKKIRIFNRKVVTYFCLFFALITALLYPLPAVFFYRHFRKDNDTNKLRYHRLLCRYFRYMLYRIPKVKITIDNPNRETFAKPSIIICNHQSHLDLLSLLSLSPRIVALTNEWVWNFPVYKPVLRYLEYYPATEGLENSLAHLSSLIERGYSIVIFPEGTRSEECKILKFRRGAFFLAEQLDCDIVPVYLEGPGKVLPKHNLMLHKGEIAIHVGKRVHPSDTQMGDNYREKTRNWHKYYLELEKCY